MKKLMVVLLAVVMAFGVTGLVYAAGNTVTSGASGDAAPGNVVCLGPRADSMESRAVYKVAVSGGSYLKIEAVDCCIVGDTWKIVAKMKQPTEQKQKTKFSGDGGYACCPSTGTYSKTLTFSGWTKGKIRVKPVDMPGGFAACAFVLLTSDGTITWVQKKGADCCN